MANLLRFEFRKVFRSKYFYILLGVSVLYVLLAGGTAFLLNFFLSEASEEAMSELIPSYTSYSFLKGVFASNFFMIIGVFIAIFTCEDNGHDVSKNIIARGYSRVERYFAKYIGSLVMTLGIALVTVLAAALFSLLAFGVNTFDPNGDNVAVAITGIILGVIVYHAVLYAVSSSIGKTAGAIVFNLLVPTGIALLLTVGDILLANLEMFKDMDIAISNYWLDGIIANFTTMDPDSDLYVADFILLFFYYAIAHLVGLLIIRKKQY